MAYSFPNVNSLFENSSTFVFPSESDIVSAIPLWMKFYCFEYSNSAFGRAQAFSRSRTGKSIPGSTKCKAQIFVPAPNNFTSTTQHSYKSEATSSTTFQLYSALQSLKNFVGPKLGGIVGETEKQIEEFANDTFRRAIQAQATIVSPVAPAFGADIPVDTTDVLYKPGGQVRSYEVQMYMPCLSVQDSTKAGQIIRTFEALSLPTIISALSLTRSVMFHPPLWLFGIGPLDNLQIDPDWSGAPQLSVLRTVKSKRIALESNTIAALGGRTTGEYKPVAYTLTLVFQELEPAIRITGGIGRDLSTTIGSRSIGVVTTGSGVPNIPTVI